MGLICARGMCSYVYVCVSEQILEHRSARRVLIDISLSFLACTRFSLIIFIFEMNARAGVDRSQIRSSSLFGSRGLSLLPTYNLPTQSRSKSHTVGKFRFSEDGSPGHIFFGERERVSTEYERRLSFFPSCPTSSTVAKNTAIEKINKR